MTETRQVWDRKLSSGLRIKEIFNIGLLNRIRLIRQGRKWKNDLPQEPDHYKTAAKVCAYIAFWCAGMMLWYKFLLEGVR